MSILINNVLIPTVEGEEFHRFKCLFQILKGRLSRCLGVWSTKIIEAILCHKLMCICLLGGNVAIPKTQL